MNCPTCNGPVLLEPFKRPVYPDLRRLLRMSDPTKPEPLHYAQHGACHNGHELVLRDGSTLVLSEG